MEKIKINDITVRDIFQSIDLRYINIKILDSVLGYLNELGFESLEVWGGFSFEKMLESKFGKSPWEILSYIKERTTSTPLQVLIGAKNLVGLEAYSKNIIEKFIKCSIKNGIDIFRVYDSLNDLDNLKFTISKIIENGKKCQGTIIYDELNDTQYYVEMAKNLQELGCSSICIKDVQSTLTPSKSAGLFQNLRSNITIPLFFSTYDIKGLQNLNYYEACTNGCDGIDFSFIPLSSTHDLTIFPFILSLKNTNMDTSINQTKAFEFYNYLKKNIYPHLEPSSYFNLIWKNTSANLFPKWVINNLVKQLGEIGETEKLDQVMEEIFRIKKEIGSPPLATPVCQIIGSQAILNTIISDYRWEIICDEMKKLLTGCYGKLPHNIDKDLLEKVKDMVEVEKEAEDYKIEEDIYEQCKNELATLSSKEEDILSYCFFPEKTRKSLENQKNISERTIDTSLKEIEKIKEVSEKSEEYVSQNIQDQEAKIASNLENLDISKLKEITHLVETSNISEIKLELDGIKISINKFGSENKQAKVTTKEEAKVKAEVESKFVDKSIDKPHRYYPDSKDIVEIKSPIVGTFYITPSPGTPPLVNVGDRVKKGDVLCIIEAMKLMNKITSDYDGEIKEILVENEEAVEFNQTLMIIKIEN